MKTNEFLALPKEQQNALVDKHVFGNEHQIVSREYVTDGNDMLLVIERMRTSTIFEKFCIYLAEMFRANTDDYEHNTRSLLFYFSPQAVAVAALKAVGFLED